MNWEERERRNRYRFMYSLYAGLFVMIVLMLVFAAIDSPGVTIDEYTQAVLRSQSAKMRLESRILRWNVTKLVLPERKHFLHLTDLAQAVDSLFDTYYLMYIERVGNNRVEMGFRWFPNNDPTHWYELGGLTKLGEAFYKDPKLESYIFLNPRLFEEIWVGVYRRR
jgi:hypothetical protein